MAPNLYRIPAESGDGDVDHREAGLFDAVDTVPAVSSPAYSRAILTKFALHSGSHGLVGVAFEPRDRIYSPIHPSKSLTMLSHSASSGCLLTGRPARPYQ